MSMSRSGAARPASSWAAGCGRPRPAGPPRHAARGGRSRPPRCGLVRTRTVPVLASGVPSGQPPPRAWPGLTSRFGPAVVGRSAAGGGLARRSGWLTRSGGRNSSRNRTSEWSSHPDWVLGRPWHRASPRPRCSGVVPARTTTSRELHHHPERLCVQRGVGSSYRVLGFRDMWWSAGRCRPRAGRTGRGPVAEGSCTCGTVRRGAARHARGGPGRRGTDEDCSSRPNRTAS